MTETESDGLAGAALVARKTPLLGGQEDQPPQEAPSSQGWFSGPLECARVLTAMVDGTLKSGQAFGGPWPWIEVGDGLLSPGLPVVTTSTEQQGPDGMYRRKGTDVLREAGGREATQLSTIEPPPGPSPIFDVLWFDDTARFLVRNGVVEIEDLFSRMVTPARRATIERCLVRRQRRDPEILDRIPTHDCPDGEATMEVARAIAVTAPRWQDPEAFFRRGVGFDNVEVKGDRLVARGEGRSGVEFSLETNEAGWLAVSMIKGFPFMALAAQREGNDVVLSGTLAAEIDPLAAGMRERLAFDLRSFLVSL